MARAYLLFVLLLSFCCTSCVTNYYQVTLTEETQLFNDKNLNEPITYIPANTEVLVSGAKARKKIKYGSYSGYAWNPSYSGSTNYGNNYSSKSSTSKRTKAYSSPPSGGKSVHVKGYTRKDGTYVKSHTRSSARRK